MSSGGWPVKITEVNFHEHSPCQVIRSSTRVAKETEKFTVKKVVYWYTAQYYMTYAKSSL